MTCDQHNNYTLDAVKLTTNDYDTLNPGDINHSIASLCCNIACGIDVLFAEHLLYASPEIHDLLSICFNAFIVHGFLPNPLMDTINKHFAAWVPKSKIMLNKLVMFFF